MHKSKNIYASSNPFINLNENKKVLINITDSIPSFIHTLKSNWYFAKKSIEEV